MRLHCLSRYKRCRKLGPVESKGVTLGVTGPGTAEVVFTTHKDARSAAGKLQGKTLKGATLSAVLKTRANQRAPAPVGQQASTAAESGGMATHSGNTKKFRLIVRNLPFTCTDAVLRKACAKFGPVFEASIVKDGTTQKPKGFAFVQYVVHCSSLFVITSMFSLLLISHVVNIPYLCVLVLCARFLMCVCVRYTMILMPSL